MRAARGAFVALVGFVCACGGGGTQSEFVPLDHIPIPWVPPPDRTPNELPPTGGGPSPDPVELLELTTFESAIGVIGQKDYAGQAENQGGGPTAKSLNAGAYDAAGCSAWATASHLWIADQNNNRILRYPAPVGVGLAADIVQGQLSMTTAFPGLSEGDFHLPSDVEVSGSSLLISDSANHRIVIYTHLPTTTGDWGQVAVGQPDLYSKLARTTADGLIWPTAICVAAGKLIVADTGNNRVLIWNEIPKTDGVPANIVLGQPNFTTSTAKLTASGMDRPSGVWSNGKKLIVCDSWHHRILIWNAFPTTNAKKADLVLGQPDFTSTTTNQIAGSGWPHASPHPDVMWHPYDVTSNGTQIVVADSGMRRVLIWSVWPTGVHERPDIVLGQSNFFHGHPNDDDQDHAQDATPSKRTFSYPTTVHIDGKRLYVGDAGNHRVLIFE